jgi:hypothetical protein
MTQACVGCTADAQCASDQRCYRNNCCQPRGCDASKPDCGDRDDGCGGIVHCGACALGQCTKVGLDLRCTTVGTACQPGASGQCVVNERCLPDSKHGDYRCAPNDQDSSCRDFIPCYGEGANDPISTSTCFFTAWPRFDNGYCALNCLTQSDCPPQTTCTQAWQRGRDPISPTSPGQCVDQIPDMALHAPDMSNHS